VHRGVGLALATLVLSVAAGCGEAEEGPLPDAGTKESSTSSPTATSPTLAMRAAGAVEHAYTRSGSYAIHVSRTYTVQFTIPGGPVTVENAFTIPGPDTVLPVGEIQTRVDSTG